MGKSSSFNSAIVNSYIRELANRDVSKFGEVIKARKNDSRRAFHILVAIGKKYNFGLHVGDSVTPVGNFNMTMREALDKNKIYEHKLFNSTDPTYRLRKLKMKDGKEFKNDRDEIFMMLRRNDTTTRVIREEGSGHCFSIDTCGS